MTTIRTVMRIKQPIINIYMDKLKEKVNLTRGYCRLCGVIVPVLSEGSPLHLI